ncbi:MAG: ATP-binding protein [Phycisphaerales bacterium]|nr:ATP-binding protein [Phycisphaerales bacterium]
MTDIFDRQRLPAPVAEFLRDSNPWWEGKPGPVQPSYRRWAFGTLLKRLRQGPASITVIRGPRQVGKTTLQQQLIRTLIDEERVEPQRIFRVQFDELPSLRGLDDPVLALSRWFENRVLGATFNERAHEGRPAFIFLDEVQNLPEWAPQVKALVDHHSVRVLVTGSSALRIEAGRDSLAGRISSIELGPLVLREVAGLRFAVHLDPFLPENGLEPLLRHEFWRDLQAHGVRQSDVRDRAFEAFAERGGYPMAQTRADDRWPAVAEQLNETVVKRAIEHDLRMGERGKKRDSQLLEEVFRLACRYAGQSPGAPVFVPQVRQALSADVGWTRLLAYLKFLDGAMLLKLVEPLELRLKRRRGAAKICLCDHALRAAWLQEQVPLTAPALASAIWAGDLAGHIAESITGYFLAGLPHLGLKHFPERGSEPEVDFVMVIGEHRIPVEVKFRQRIDPHRDTQGIRAFLEKSVYNAPFGLMVTMRDEAPEAVRDPRIITISLPSLLLMR